MKKKNTKWKKYKITRNKNVVYNFCYDQCLLKTAWTWAKGMMTQSAAP